MARASQMPSAMRSMAPALMLIKAALSHGGTIRAVFMPDRPNFVGRRLDLDSWIPNSKACSIFSVRRSARGAGFSVS